MKSEESMAALSEVLRDLIQDPIKSIYHDNISDDVEKVKNRLRKFDDISSQIKSVHGEFEDVENQLNYIVDLSVKYAGGLSELTDNVLALNERINILSTESLKSRDDVIDIVKKKATLLDKGNEEILGEVRAMMPDLMKDNSEIKSDLERIDKVSASNFEVNKGVVDLVEKKAIALDSGIEAIRSDIQALMTDFMKTKADLKSENEKRSQGELELIKSVKNTRLLVILAFSFSLLTTLVFEFNLLEML